MPATDNYRRQHRELLELTQKMSKELNETTLENDAGTVRNLLSEMAGKISVHLEMEDKSLYPSLLDSEDNQVRSTAKQFQDEMGGIAAAFKEYVSKYPTANAIKDDAPGFIKETTGIFDVLAKRIDQENTILYEMIDNTN